MPPLRLLSGSKIHREKHFERDGNLWVYKPKSPPGQLLRVRPDWLNLIVPGSVLLAPVPPLAKSLLELSGLGQVRAGEAGANHGPRSGSAAGIIDPPKFEAMLGRHTLKDCDRGDGELG